MCVNCLTSFEVVAAGGLGAAGVASRFRVGLRMMLGLPAHDRRAHQTRVVTDRAFYASLGLDPDLYVPVAAEDDRVLVGHEA